MQNSKASWGVNPMLKGILCKAEHFYDKETLQTRNFSQPNIYLAKNNSSLHNIYAN